MALLLAGRRWRRCVAASGRYREAAIGAGGARIAAATPISSRTSRHARGTRTVMLTPFCTAVLGERRRTSRTLRRWRRRYAKAGRHGMVGGAPGGRRMAGHVHGRARTGSRCAKGAKNIRSDLGRTIYRASGGVVSSRCGRRRAKAAEGERGRAANPLPLRAWSDRRCAGHARLCDGPGRPAGRQVRVLGGLPAEHQKVRPCIAGRTPAAGRPQVLILEQARHGSGTFCLRRTKTGRSPRVTRLHR